MMSKMGIVGNYPFSQTLSILPIVPRLFTQPTQPTLSSNLHYTQKKSDSIEVALFSVAEGTGFEPADTLRYRQFSKLLV